MIETENFTELKENNYVCVVKMKIIPLMATNGNTQKTTKVLIKMFLLWKDG